MNNHVGSALMQLETLAQYSTIVSVGAILISFVSGITLWLFRWWQERLNDSEKDVLKAVTQYKQPKVSIVPGELLPCIVQKCVVEYRNPSHAELTVSPHFWQSCESLVERGYLRREAADYILTSKGIKYNERNKKQLGKREFTTTYIDRVAQEKERRSRPNVMKGTLHETPFSLPITSGDTSFIFTLAEYPTSSQTGDVAVRIFSGLRWPNLEEGQFVYFKCRDAPLFLDTIKVNDSMWLNLQVVSKSIEQSQARVFYDVVSLPLSSHTSSDVEWG